MKFKKSQMQTQVFVYIMSALVVGLTFYFGYKAITNVEKVASDAALLSFKSEISEKLLGMLYGNIELYTIRPPSGYMVCFTNGTISYSDKMVEQFLKNAYAKTGKNIYLVNKNSGAVSEIKSPELKVSGTSCIENKREITLEGKGKYVEVTI